MRIVPAAEAGTVRSTPPAEAPRPHDKAETGATIELLDHRLDDAERLALAGINELQRHKERGFLSTATTILAEIRLAQGRYREALELADEAERIGGPDDRAALIGAHTARTRAHLALGATEQARAAANAAVTLAASIDAYRFQADAHLAHAEVLAATGELAAARAAARRSRRLYAALQFTLDEQRAAKLAEHSHDEG